MLAEWWQQFSNVDSENLIIFCHFYVCCLLFPKYCAFSLFKFKICYFLSFFFSGFGIVQFKSGEKLRLQIALFFLFFFFSFHLIGAPILLVDWNLWQFLIRNVALKPSPPSSSPFTPQGCGSSAARWSPICTALQRFLACGGGGFFDLLQKCMGRVLSPWARWHLWCWSAVLFQISMFSSTLCIETYWKLRAMHAKRHYTSYKYIT